MKEVSVDDFKQEVDCTYDGEKYSVRDNGAVFRHKHEGKNGRVNDNKWTFGRKSTANPYLHLSGVRIHRIVATAFHGEPTDPKYVVDHIDTNCRNNRPENLRWLSRIDNALKNPVTRKKIEYLCGSIEAFRENPSMLNELQGNLNFNWMRTVSKEEARVSRERLESWARSDKPPKGGALGEWLFVTENPTFESAPQYDDQDIDSLTPGATQRNWKCPSEFPMCPDEFTDNPLHDYVSRLEDGAVFSRNRYGESVVDIAELNKDGTCLSVICRIDSWVKNYAVAKVTVEEDKYIHTSVSTYFTYDGAEKSHCALIDKPWKEPEGYAGCIDDYC